MTLEEIDQALTEYPHHFERTWFCFVQLTHAITNLPVEYLRLLLNKLGMNPQITWFGRGKDLAYWLGHVVLYAFIVWFVIWI